MPSNICRPNVILVMTDDQGYADLGCTGNPWLKTPNIDAFHDIAFRLPDFHVSPLCTPTRGAIMSGKRPVRNGAWATCWGRSILRKTETTMADVFKANGYRTAMFGKWHLGDNAPYRPFERGFEHVVAHKGGGVGQTPDYWGNNYFDDTYFHNGDAQAHEGYCTDIWFDEAKRYIEQHVDEPFFVYISTNAPHDPYLVAESYKDPYRDDKDIYAPAFYGMIANIDENFGKLRSKLQELNLEENTILIFMCDKGSSGACRVDQDGFVAQGYNAGMRGKKGSYYDGGHRVPFFIRWPQGGLNGPQNINEMSLHIDMLPTLAELCGLELADDPERDGMSLAPLLRGEADALPVDRVHFLQYRQNTELPKQWENCVMTRQWRLVYGEELYDIQSDPGQRHNLAAKHPEVVARLREAHEQWWAEIRPQLDAYCPISLGSDAENPAALCAMDVLGDVAWQQRHVIQAQRSTGQWAVEVERPGRYRFSLRRWSDELDLPIDEAISPEEARRHCYAADDDVAVLITPVKATLGLFGQEWQVAVEPGQKEATFEIDLDQAGVTLLDAWFYDADGDKRGAYYVYVERL